MRFSVILIVGFFKLHKKTVSFGVFVFSYEYSVKTAALSFIKPFLYDKSIHL